MQPRHDRFDPPRAGVEAPSYRPALRSLRGCLAGLPLFIVLTVLAVFQEVMVADLQVGLRARDVLIEGLSVILVDVLAFFMLNPLVARLLPSSRARSVILFLPCLALAVAFAAAAAYTALALALEPAVLALQCDGLDCSIDRLLERALDAALVTQLFVLPASLLWFLFARPPRERTG